MSRFLLISDERLKCVKKQALLMYQKNSIFLVVSCFLSRNSNWKTNCIHCYQKYTPLESWFFIRAYFFKHFNFIFCSEKCTNSNGIAFQSWHERKGMPFICYHHHQKSKKTVIYTKKKYCIQLSFQMREPFLHLMVSKDKLNNFFLLTSKVHPTQSDLLKYFFILDICFCPT